MSLKDVLQIPEAENLTYTYALAAGNFIVAEYIYQQTKNEERRQKIARVLKIKRDALNALSKQGSHRRAQDTTPTIAHWKPEWKNLLLIDLVFASPFAPFEIKYDEEDQQSALRTFASGIGVANFDNICASRREAMKAHRKVDWLRIGLIGGGAIVVCAAGGWLAAPMLGSALGTAAGLSGAAAVGHGLALLGGGALAAGGAGMAGGIWVVVGVSAAGGGLVAGSSTLFFQLGTQAARVEILKFETAFKSVILAQQEAVALAKQSIEKLQQELKALQDKLAKERELNEKRAKQLQDLEEKIGMIERALRWMQKQSA